MTTRHSGRPAAGRSGRRDVALRTAVLLTLALTPLGCTTSADAADDSASGDIDAASAAPAAEPVPISSFNEATYTSLVADRDGALHAVWLDRNPETQRQAVYHRSSSDDGRSWDDPTFLSEGQPDGYTGIPRVVADGAGRVYAVWKMVDRGTSMAEQELLSRPAYGTLVYRVLEGGRWSPVRAVGAERAVVAWFAATDPRGRVHVVWSENPDGPGFLSTTADAGAVRQAQLDGATPRGGQVISGASRFGKLGYWSLSGYVDGNGGAHWVAVRGNDADDRSILVHSTGGRERTLPWYTAAAQAAGARTPPQLVLDASGGEHLVLYEGGPRPRLLDHGVNREPYTDTLVTGADAESIQDFQLSSAGGRIAVTMEITGDDGNRLADLYVATWNGDGWTRPARVIDNGTRTRAQGVTDARARSLGTVKVQSAIHASVVPTRTGALHVLLTNRETSRHVDTRAGGMSGASARSRAWFVTVQGVVAAGAGGGGERTPVPTPAEPGPARVAGGASRVASTREAERLFAQYDITEGGWLSGTELYACDCRGDDANGDGEVTKAEFVAGFLRRGGASPAPTSGRGSTPSRPAPTPAARLGPPNRDAEPAPATGSGTTGDVATGKYNCYANGARRPMPWEPGFGGVSEAPRATTQYLMNLTVGENGNYQYLNRGRGSLRLDGRTGMIDWLSGPFANSGIRAAYARRGDGRPVIYLELEGTRAHCVGPQQ